MAQAPLGDRSKNYNRFLLMIVVILLILIPLWMGVYGATLWQDGVKYWSYYLMNPFEKLIPRWYGTLAPYAWKNFQFASSEGTAVPMLVYKVLGPPFGAVLLSLLVMFLVRAPLMDFRPFKGRESVHGDAKWADERDIRRAGLLKKKGFLLGTWKKGYLCIDGFQHILLFAPTGSGKGVGFVLPNLLYWDESVVCHDIKLENWELTSGYRQAKLDNKCFVWNPADPDGNTHCYNPIDWVSTKPGQMVDDVQKIANLVLPEQEFWQNEARSLFVGVLLYLLAVPEKMKSFGEVVRTMRSDDVTYNLAVVLDTVGKKMSPVAYMNIAAFLQKADKERSGVISTLNSGLELWANPLIDTATATSDFNIQVMKKEKITVFCGVTPDNLQRLQPLLQVFYQQATDFFTRKMPQDDEPYGVLMVMDEFPSLGKMPQFETGIAYFRGYHVRLFLIVQDTQQLKGIYEEAGMNSFLSNSTYRITFAANNVETANLISQLVGNKTVQQESHNRPKFLDLNPASRTLHVSETARALLLPQEVIGLPKDEQILLIESEPPIKTKKIFYYKDPFFTKRLMDPSPIPQQEPYDPNKAQKGAEPKEENIKKEAKEVPSDAPKQAGKPAGMEMPKLPQKEKPKTQPTEDAKAAKPASPMPKLPPLPDKKTGDTKAETNTDTKPKMPSLPPLPQKEASKKAPPLPSKKETPPRAGMPKMQPLPAKEPVKKETPIDEPETKEKPSKTDGLPPLPPLPKKPTKPKSEPKQEAEPPVDMITEKPLPIDDAASEIVSAKEETPDILAKEAIREEEEFAQTNTPSPNTKNSPLPKPPSKKKSGMIDLDEAEQTIQEKAELNMQQSPVFPKPETNEDEEDTKEDTPIEPKDEDTKPKKRFQLPNAPQGPPKLEDDTT